MHQNRTSFEHPTNLRPRRHHRSGMLTHLSDMDTVSVCSFRPQKPHMQIEMNEDVKTGPIAQVSFFSVVHLLKFSQSPFLLFIIFSFLLLYCFLYYCCLISFSFHFLYFSFILFFFFYFLIFFNFFFFGKLIFLFFHQLSFS